MTTERRYARMARVNELVREVVAEEIERRSDPALGFVTITGVHVTGDLRAATVYYSALRRDDAEAQDEAQTALAALAPHLQGVLARQARLKYTPTLVFRPDPAVSQGERVEQILRELKSSPTGGNVTPTGGNFNPTGGNVRGGQEL